MGRPDSDDDHDAQERSLPERVLLFAQWQRYLAEVCQGLQSGQPWATYGHVIEAVFNTSAALLDVVGDDDDLERLVAEERHGRGGVERYRSRGRQLQRTISLRRMRGD